MTEIERIIKSKSLYQHSLFHDDVLRTDVKSLAKALEQYVLKARIEELEKLQWKPRESWADDVVRHNGQIENRIAQLKKELGEDKQ